METSPIPTYTCISDYDTCGQKTIGTCLCIEININENNILLGYSWDLLNRFANDYGNEILGSYLLPYQDYHLITRINETNDFYWEVRGAKGNKSETVYYSEDKWATTNK